MRTYVNLHMAHLLSNWNEVLVAPTPFAIVPEPEGVGRCDFSIALSRALEGQWHVSKVSHDEVDADCAPLAEPVFAVTDHYQESQPDFQKLFANVRRVWENFQQEADRAEIEASR